MRREETPSPDRLAALIRRFPGRRIAVVGDLVADEFVYGEIARVSREAPVLILEHRETVAVPGGAGNAVANLRALGAEPLPVGVVGKDPPGRRLLDHFRRIGVATSGIGTAEGYETPTKSRIIAGGVHTRRQQVVRLDRGMKHGPLPRVAQGGVRKRLLSALRRAEGLLIADYGYGAAPPDVLRGIGRRDSLPITVDSRGRVVKFARVTACTPNQEELELALDLSPLRAEESLERAGQDLLRCTGNEAILVTRGARGMCLFERGRPARRIPAFGSDEVADVTGAGDTVIAVFTLAQLAGGSFVEAALLANVAAGLVVMKAGTATVSRREMLAAIEEER